MDRDEIVRLLKGGQNGIARWNKRRNRSKVDLNLSGVDLRAAVLCNVDLSFARLDGAIFVGADLSNAHLHKSDLRGANLSSADLYASDLTGAKLGDADLNWADFSAADLTAAELCRANLSGAIFRDADLARAEITGAVCHSTVFASVDLSQVKGLDLLVHKGPSTVGIDTLIRSQGKIPKQFLRGSGVPDVLISCLPDLLAAMRPFQFHSCFISYSTKDENFATKLHADFKAAGIPCWKWDHDARTGQTIWGEIDRAIVLHDKLVLIASESSLKSPQVNREIERAIQEEDKRTKLKLEGKYEGDTNVLFPVRVDDFVFEGWSHPRKADVIAKVIADARGWSRSRKIYPAVRDRMIEHLKAGESVVGPIASAPAR